MKILVYEGGNGGHRIEYIEYLIQYLILNPELKKDYVFVISSKLRNQLVLNESLIGGIQIITLSLSDSPSNLTKRSFKEWKLIKQLLIKHPSIEKIVFMNLDMFQLVVLRPDFLKFQLEVSGILFQPYVHVPIPREFNFTSIKTKLKILRKKVTLKFIFAFTKKLSVFVLNDEQGVNELNHVYKANKIRNFRYLPDPIDHRCLLNHDTKPYICSKYKIDTDRKILLVFGKIDFRKNLERIIKAISSLSIEEQKKVALVIAGKFVVEMENRINYLVSVTLEKHEHLQIIINNDFIKNEEREALFKAADIVMMPYINFYSSSGVVGHAAKYKKKVIVSSLGIVNKIVEKYSLGIAVNSNSIEEIRNGIESILEPKHEYQDKNDSFCNSHHYNMFSKLFLGHEQSL